MLVHHQPGLDEIAKSESSAILHKVIGTTVFQNKCMLLQ